ncbi:transcriptional regulator BetI [Hyphomicrobium facile]|uniref:Transcriptional repressor BetI n=1 Tax=Hyphomicrobium facile TaxID=51670 RepID=A0A1I7MUS4_9HYPH|nr:transcriptional regulator BetI [Hyphomicrobium facile]SFV26096.1 transcriptional repressor BetI [Hyphomicrobium facile]
MNGDMGERRSEYIRLEQLRSFEAERRRHLIMATIETVSKVGFKSASLSEIAIKAGVSQSLFAHYFGDKDGLLEATLRFMAARLSFATAARMREARTPLQRVLAVPEAALDAEQFDPRTSAVWLAFWGKIAHSEPYRRVQSIYQRRMRSNLRHGLRSLVAPARVDVCATLIAATIDGLWLQSHATGRADAAKARAIVSNLVNLLVEKTEFVEFDAASPPIVMTASERLNSDAVISNASGALLTLRTTNGERRSQSLQKLALLLRSEIRSIARLQARDTGRPVGEIERFDMPQVISSFERAAELASRPQQVRHGFEETVFGYLEREPVGVVVANAHWNSPLLTGSEIAAPALALANAVIICVPGARSRAVDRLCSFAHEVGIPDAALKSVGGHVAEGLLRRPDVLTAGRGGLAKSAVIVLEDADLDLAAESLVRGPRSWARSRSFSETLLFVSERARTGFIARLREKVATLAVGNPLDIETEVGSLPSKRHLAEALTRIQEARNAGAELRLGGRELENYRGRAAILKPTILDCCNTEMRIVRESLYCPVFLVIPFKEDEEVELKLRAIGPNLSLGIFGRDLTRIWRVARNTQAAICRVNDARKTISTVKDDWLEGHSREELLNRLCRTRRILASGDGLRPISPT